MAVWLRPPTTPILLVVAAFGLVAGRFDAREALIQAGRADRLLFMLVALIAVLHLGSAMLATAMARRSTASLVRL